MLGNPYAQGVVDPILNDITTSVEDILNSHAIQLNGVIRQQRAEVQRVIDAKTIVFMEMEKEFDNKQTNKIINDMQKKFEDEQKKLIHETNKLKMSIIEAIRKQNCDESKEKMLNVTNVLTGLTQTVKGTTTAVQMYAEQEQEQHIFSNMMSGFTKTFYRILDRVQDSTNNAIKTINEKFETPVDVDYGIDAMNDNLSVSTTKSFSTNYTSRTAKLLDNAFQPSMGCIARTGLEQLQVGLANIRDELYKFIFSDILSVSDRTSDIQRRREILDRGIPQGVINLGYNSPQSSIESNQSSIDTEILPSLPGSPVSKTDTISLGEIPPFYPPPLRRHHTEPTKNALFMPSEPSTKSHNPRLGQEPFKGVMRSSNGRVGRLSKPFGPPLSKRGSHKRKGGKKHRKTAHKRKNN